MTRGTANSSEAEADREVRLARARASRRQKREFEEVAQTEFVRWARFHRGWVVMHVPNELGRSRNYARAAWLKKMGLLPGAPDILLMTPAANFALEFKSEWEEPSAEQVRVLAGLKAIGWKVAVVYSDEEARRFVATEIGALGPFCP